MLPDYSIDWKRIREIEATTRKHYAKFRGDVTPIVEDISDAALKEMQREYRGLSRRGWARIGAPTLMLSRMRVRYRTKNGELSQVGKIKTQKQLESRTRNARPLIDTGRTLRTLVRGTSMNVFKPKYTTSGNVSSWLFTIGSSSPILEKHQKSHTSTFKFGAAEERNFDRNVEKRRGRAVGGRNPTGKWNTFYFIQRARLRKMAGKSYTVPARPLPLQMIANTFQARLDRRVRAKYIATMREMKADLLVKFGAK